MGVFKFFLPLFIHIVILYVSLECLTIHFLFVRFSFYLFLIITVKCFFHLSLAVIYVLFISLIGTLIL